MASAGVVQQFVLTVMTHTKTILKSRPRTVMTTLGDAAVLIQRVAQHR